MTTGRSVLELSGTFSINNKWKRVPVLFIFQLGVVALAWRRLFSYRLRSCAASGTGKTGKAVRSCLSGRVLLMEALVCAIRPSQTGAKWCSLHARTGCYGTMPALDWPVRGEQQGRLCPENVSQAREAIR